MNKYIFLLLCCAFSCCAQNQPPKQNTKNSFCYWKTSFSESKEDDSLFQKLNVHHIYLRFFDINWNPYSKEALPVSTLSQWNMVNAENKTFTPSIFITNAVLEHTTKGDLDTLAQRISKRVASTISNRLENDDFGAYDYIDKHFKGMGNYGDEEYKEKERLRDSIKKARYTLFCSTIKEILIDCDWTEKTKDNYFYLLSQLKKEMKDYTISATIRLWQYKYSEKAGIPPVDRGLLMCYNMESHKKMEVENSIGSAEELAKYLTNKDYRLDLDVVLPIFQWSVLFSNGQYKGIISDLGNNINLKDTALFLAAGENKYLFKQDMEVGEYYVRNGDEIRMERISPDELLKMANLVKEKVRISADTRISLFSWDKKFVDYYGNEQISKVFEVFK